MSAWSNTFNIARREFRGYFNGPVAYIVLCLVMLAVGFFFWETFFLFGKATAREMFRWLSIVLYFAVPALTMGLLAEEKRTGTIELLITMPVTEAQVIVGKFLGVFGLFAVLLLLTLPYPISISSLGNLDWGPVVTGYIGLLLKGGALIAVGIAASAWTDNQIVAFFIALAFSVSFFVVDKFLPLMPANLASILEWLAFDYHYESMMRGVLALRDVLYFLSIIVIGLGVAFRALESRRWS